VWLDEMPELVVLDIWEDPDGGLITEGGSSVLGLTEIAEWFEDVLDIVGKLELMTLSKIRVVYLGYLVFLCKMLSSHVILRPNSNFWAEKLQQILVKLASVSCLKKK
jgi:hypothetical protein